MHDDIITREQRKLHKVEFPTRVIRAPRRSRRRADQNSVKRSCLEQQSSQPFHPSSLFPTCPTSRWRIDKTHKTAVRTTTPVKTTRTIHMAATMLTTTINRTRPTTRGDTISTPEFPDIRTIWIGTPQVLRVTRPYHRRRRVQRRMSTTTRWPELDQEGDSLARELSSVCTWR